MRKTIVNGSCAPARHALCHHPLAKRGGPELAEHVGPWLLKALAWALAAIIALPLFLHLLLPLLV